MSIGDRAEVKYHGKYRFGTVTKIDATRRTFWLRFDGNDWDHGPFNFELRMDV